jgi:hypothetical protein
MEGYLGVDIQQDGNQITLLQAGLTKQIIAALGLDSKYSTPVDTPQLDNKAKEFIQQVCGKFVFLLAEQWTAPSCAQSSPSHPNLPNQPRI